MNKSLRYILVGLVFMLGLQAEAQVKEISFQFSSVQSKLIPEENFINEDLIIREGRRKGGFAIGMTYAIGPPKNQKKKGFNLGGKILFEANICRCGGQLTSTTTLLNGSKSLSQIDYTFYRGDYSAKLVLQLSRLMFLVGPTVNNLFYSGYQVLGDDETLSAAGDFPTIGLGYEYGFGLDLDRVNFTVRYQNQLTDFGTSFRGKEATVGNNLYRFVLSYRMYQKHKGLNWDSIIWD